MRQRSVGRPHSSSFDAIQSNAASCMTRDIALGMTGPPAQLLALMRLEEAKRLLRGSSLTVAEIARKTGYCNPAYLVNVFRAATGLSPKKWRNSGR